MTGDEGILVPGVEPRRQRHAPPIVLVMAALAQGGVLFLTFVMGLMWDGWTYAVALLQASLLLGAVLRLASRRSWLALAVPLLSAALSLGLFLFFDKVESDAACTSDMREATAQVRPLPGTHVTFNGEVENGCIARFSVPASDADSVLPHYRREFTRHGWEITAEEADAGCVTEDGTPCPPSTGIGATKGGIRMGVEVPEGEPGSEGEGSSLVLIEVGHTS